MKSFTLKMVMALTALCPLLGEAQNLPQSISLKKIDGGNLISCALFKKRLGLLLQRNSEFDILYQIKKNHLEPAILDRLAGIVQRSLIPLPGESDLLELTVVFNIGIHDFVPNDFKYRIQTGFYDFKGVSPYFLKGNNIEILENGFLRFVMSMSYLEACLDLKDIRIELEDTDGKQLKFLVKKKNNSHLLL